MQEDCGLVPHVGVVAEAEEALLVGEHDAAGNEDLVLNAEGVGPLPGDVLLPQFQLHGEREEK